MESIGASEFACIYADHHAGVLAAARRVLADPGDAEEVAQDVFLTLWLRPGHFDPSRGPLRAYLRLLARSRALDRWRARDAASRSVDRVVRAAVTSAASTEDVHDAAERREQLRDLCALAGKLPTAQRETLALSCWAGLTTREIAARSGVPDATARSRLRLARRRVVEALSDAA